MRTSLFFALLLCVACGDDDASIDGGVDASLADAQVDSSDGALPDAGEDAAVDAAEDSGADASPDAPDPNTCELSDPLEEGEHTLTVEGRERRYILRLPSAYDGSERYPVIFALHGNGGNPDYWDSEGGDRDIRAGLGDRAILVIAEAIDNRWRDYDMDEETWGPRMEEELLYFDAIRSELASGTCANTDEMLSMGFSGGGSFSGVLGCRRDYIRAFSAGGSVIYFDTEACTNVPAAWITIGQGELAEGRERFRDFFRDHAGCEPAEAPTEGCVEYTGCDEAVVYCTHEGDHRWPDFGVPSTRDFFFPSE